MEKLIYLLLMEGNFQTLFPLLKERGWTKFQAENGDPLKKYMTFLKLFKMEKITIL